MTQVGESFLDRTGQRWWVKGLRPGSTDQFVVEAQMQGSYPRVALYVMTAREFEAHARAAQFRPERSKARTGAAGDHPG
jgi:hypothetical protein